MKVCSHSGWPWLTLAPALVSKSHFQPSTFRLAPASGCTVARDVFIPSCSSDHLGWAICSSCAVAESSEVCEDIWSSLSFTKPDGKTFEPESLFFSNCTSPPVPKIWHGDMSPLLSRLHREYPLWSFHIYLVLTSAVLAKATAPKKQRNHLSPGDCAIWGHQEEDLLQNDLSSLCHPADFFDKPKIRAGNSRDNCCALLLHCLPRDSNCSWQKKSSAPLLYFLVSNRGAGTEKKKRKKKWLIFQSSSQQVF